MLPRRPTPEDREQHEKHAPDIPTFLHNMGLAANTDVKLGGGQFVNFRRGWAKPIMSNAERAHWFERDGFDQAEALCGITSHVRWLYGPGNYERCATCIRIMSRRNKSGVSV